MQLEPTGGSLRNHYEQLRQLQDRKSVISHDRAELLAVIKILMKDKSGDSKRSEKDSNRLLPLLRDIRFFKERSRFNMSSGDPVAERLAEENLLEVCAHVSYEKFEPGGTVFS